MVVPVSGNSNFFPIDRGKKLPGRNDEQVSFDDYLVDRVEAADGYHEEADRRQNRSAVPGAGQQAESSDHDQNDSQGDGKEERKPGRVPRIDLMA